MSWGVGLPGNSKEWLYVVAGEVRAGYEEKKLCKQSGEALAWAAQGGGTIPIPGGAQEILRCGTEGYGQGAWVDGWSR